MQVGAHMHYRTLSTGTMTVSPRTQRSSFGGAAASRATNSAVNSSGPALGASAALGSFPATFASFLALSAVLLVDLMLRLCDGGIVLLAKVKLSRCAHWLQ